MTETELRRVVVAVQSLPASIAFYRDVVGAVHVAEHPPIATLQASGFEVMLHERTPRPSDAAIAPVFGVDDLDGRVAAWRDRGGEVIDEPADQPWGERMSVVRDPDGHVVCLVAR